MATPDREDEVEGDVEATAVKLLGRWEEPAMDALHRLFKPDVDVRPGAELTLELPVVVKTVRDDGVACLEPAGKARLT